MVVKIEGPTHTIAEIFMSTKTYLQCISVQIIQFIYVVFGFDFTTLMVLRQELGGNSWWFDRFLAQHIAVFYYFMTVFMYMLSPRMACK